MTLAMAYLIGRSVQAASMHLRNGEITLAASCLKDARRRFDDWATAPLDSAGDVNSVEHIREDIVECEAGLARMVSVMEATR